jgi:coproporphyrinogen III oxidase-like Fe-S oxidoreductase
MRFGPALEPAIRAALAGLGSGFRLRRPGEVHVPRVERTGLDLHVPSCRSLCPFCPCTRVPCEPGLA